MSHKPTNAPGDTIAVFATTDDDSVQQRAEKLADDLSLPLATEADRTAGRYQLLLQTRPERLELVHTRGSLGGPVFVDFEHGQTAFRRKSAGNLRQPLARAIGLHIDKGISVIDATAGLGRDAFLLACLGCTVTAIERSRTLAALLHDGLTRAQSSPSAELRAIVARITLTVADSRQVLVDIEPDALPSVVYIDPMYPDEGKSALAGKEMRICRRVVGDDDDAAELLRCAQRVARRRIVVKRAKHASELILGVSHSHVGRAVRYDVYSPMAEDSA